jgi:biopolymer transport protein ExbD
MRRHRLPNMQEGTVNVTPLIDIVMCLIIFFMLVARIGVSLGTDESIRLDDIPATRLGRDLKEIGVESSLVLNVRESSGQPTVTAIVRADGSLTASGRPEELKVVDALTGRRELAETLRRLRYGRDRKPGGGDDNDQLKVIIRGDKNMTYASLEPILIACMEANVKNVNFNTKKSAS